MDIAFPGSWAEARLDTSAPRDIAPLLAIVAAIEERFAVVRHNPSVLLPPPGGFISRWIAGEVLGAGEASGIIGAIRELQKEFISFAPPYGDRGYTGFPDHLASDAHLVGAVPPYDALARIPLVPGPAPADSTAAAATRAFYAWCRAALDEICVLETAARASAVWSASGYYDTLAEIVADASRGGGDASVGGIYISGRFDTGAVPAAAKFRTLHIPVGIGVRNESPLPADAGFAVCAPSWPCVGEWDEGDNDTFSSFGAPGVAGAPGVSTVSVRVAANGGTAVLWPDPGSCPRPTYAPPSAPDPDAPTPWQFSVGCKIVPFLDFSQSFRFHADTEEDESP